MTDAPTIIKIILALLMCTVCANVFVGLVTHEKLAFKIAGGSAVASFALWLGWRLTHKSGGASG